MREQECSQAPRQYTKVMPEARVFGLNMARDGSCFKHIGGVARLYGLFERQCRKRRPPPARPGEIWTQEQASRDIARRLCGRLEQCG